MQEQSDNAVDGAPEQAAPERLAGLDLARGLAYLGMIVVNFHLAMTWGLPRASLVPELFQDLVEGLFGRAAAAFVLVAGVGLALRVRREHRPPAGGPALILSRLGFLLFGLLCVLGAGFNAGRAALRGTASIGGLGRRANWGSLLEDLQLFVSWRPEGAAAGVMIAGLAGLLLLALLFVFAPRLFRGPRGALFLRALFLLGLGYLWQPFWSGDILHFYGLWLLLALPLLRAPSWLLLLIVLAMPIGTVGLHTFLDYGEHWSPTLEHGGFWTLLGQGRDLLFDGWHPLLPWFGFLLAGMLLGRCDLGRRRAPTLALLLGLILVVAAPPLARLTTAAAIRAADLGLAFEAERLPPSGDEPDENDDGRVDRPEGPLFMRLGIPIEHAQSPQDPAAIAGARFLARQLPEEKIEALVLEKDEAGNRLVIRLRRGADQVDRDAMVILIQRWLLGLEGADRPAWPTALNRVEVRVRDRLGDESGVLIDARDPGPLLYDEEVRILFGLEALPPGPFFFMQALGSALALVGLCFLLARLDFLRLPLRPFVLTGRMAFTLYLGHVILGMGLLDQLKLLGGQGLPLTLTVTAVVGALSLAFSAAWLTLFRRGPVEALMRRLAR